MTKSELVEVITKEFYENFAQATTSMVVANNVVEYVYIFATEGSDSLPKNQNNKLIFRSAYILEIIFFDYRQLFTPYVNRFYADFVHCNNGSARRHFAKIMKHLLDSDNHDRTNNTGHGNVNRPSQAQCEEIATRCAEWAVDPKVKVAVKIWVIEILRTLSSRVDWIEELMPEIIEPLTRDPQPSIMCRLKRWRRT